MANLHDFEYNIGVVVEVLFFVILGCHSFIQQPNITKSITMILKCIRSICFRIGRSILNIEGHAPNGKHWDAFI